MGQRRREGEEGQRERMRDALWFCSALRSPGASSPGGDRGKGRQRQESGKSKMEGKEGYKAGQSLVKLNLQNEMPKGERP